MFHPPACTLPLTRADNRTLGHFSEGLVPQRHWSGQGNEPLANREGLDISLSEGVLGASGKITAGQILSADQL